MSSISKISANEKVVIIRSANIGDWVVTIPFINYLLNEKKLNRSDIFSLVLNNSGLNPVSMILEENDILVKNSNVLKLNLNSIRNFMSKKRKTFAEFGKVDHVILLSFTHDNFLSVFKKRILAYILFGFKVSYYGFVVNNKSKNISESQYLSVFDKLDIENFHLSTSEFSFPQYSKTTSDRIRIGLYIHSKLEMKIWPMQNYINLTNLIINHYKNVEFVLLGSKDDFDYNHKFINGLKLIQPEVDISNIAGKSSINQTLIDLAQLDLLICNDGAPTHFAGLTNTPTLAIYTYKEPIGSWEPYLNNNYVSIRKDVTCKHCFFEKCINPVCIKLITENDVYPYVNKILSSANNINEIVLLTDKVSISTNKN